MEVLESETVRPSQPVELPKSEAFVRGGRSAQVVSMTHSGIFTTKFEVPARQDLPSDGRTRRMRIDTLPLEAEISHEAVPKLTSRAYLVAKVENSSELPLLAGPTRVILAGQFLGRGHFDDVAPGEEFTLALGVDPVVEIERQLVKRETDESGARHKSKVGYRIAVTNRCDVPVKLTLRDQIPLSPHKDVSVKVKDVQPKLATDPDTDGFLIWDLEVAPGESQETEFGYEIRYPAGRRPMNL
ncbi:MAG: DUF4139 domain-containing protein [Candidatus Krumholzibacteriia bacterium]